MTTIPDCLNPPPAREGCFLSWLVVNREGKLLAIVDSESEAYHYQKGRGHAEGGRYFKATLDYAAAHHLLASLVAMYAFASMMVGRNGMDGDDTMTDEDHAAWQEIGARTDIALGMAHTLFHPKKSTP